MFDASSEALIITSFIANIVSVISFVGNLAIGIKNNQQSKNEKNFDILIKKFNEKFKLNEIQDEDDKIEKLKETLRNRSKRQIRISFFSGLMVLLLSSLMIYVRQHPENYNTNSEVSFLFDKQTPFDKIQDQFKVLILPFKKSIGGKNNLEFFLKNRFIELRDEKKLNLAVKLIDHKYARSFKEANDIGKEYNADIVIFGDYDIEVMKARLSFVVINKNIQKIRNKGKSKFVKLGGVSDISQGYLQEDVDEIIYWTFAMRAMKKRDYNKTLQYLDLIKNFDNSPLKNEIIKAKMICFLITQSEDDFKNYYNHIMKDDLIHFSYFNLAYFANEYLDDNKLTVEIYKKDLKFNKNSATYNNIAVAYEANEEYEQAEKYYKLAIKFNKKSLYYKNLANLYSNDYYKNYNLSEEFYLKAIRIDSLNPESYNDLGDLYCFDNFKKFAKAKECYLDAIRIDANHLNSYFNLAHLESKYNNNIDSALYYLDEARAIDNDNSNVYYSYGKLHQFYTKKYQKAKKYYVKAIEMDGTNAYAYKNLGDLYRENYKFYSKAEENYRIAISISTNQSYFHNAMGILFLNDYKDYEKALTYFENALSKKGLSNSQKAIYLTNFASVYKNQNKYLEAEKNYLYALEYNSDYLYANLQLYYLYDKTKRYKKAMEFYKKVCKIDPKYKNNLYTISLKLKQLFSK